MSPLATAPDSGLATMVNISDEPVVIPIDFGPGHRSHRITVPPGHGAQFDIGYCRPIKGAGRAFRPPIISMLSRKDGAFRLVPESEAREKHGWEPPVDATAKRVRDLEDEVARLTGATASTGSTARARPSRSKR